VKEEGTTVCLVHEGKQALRMRVYGYPRHKEDLDEYPRHKEDLAGMS
jgi:hypothetical protein